MRQTSSGEVFRGRIKAASLSAEGAIVGKRLANFLRNFLRGLGSVLDIAPNPERKLPRRPLYEPKTPEQALYESWARVGQYLRSVSARELHGSQEGQEATRTRR